MAFNTDNQGFLLDANEWTEAWAKQCADQLSLSWDQIDIEIVLSLREFYFEFDLSPPMRPLVKQIKLTVGPEYGNSIWLMQRYGESPARVLAMLAGLPKPKNCL